MTLSTLTHRAVAGALTAAALVAVPVGLAAPADAMERVTVCDSWQTTGYATSDDKGNDVYVVESRCDGWLDLTTGEPADAPPTAEGGGFLDLADKDYCDYLRREAESLRQHIASAGQHVAQARATLDEYAAKADADYAEVERSRAALEQAERSYEDAKRYYEANNDTEVEREVRSGVVITVRLAINPRGVGARELTAAADRLDRARQSYDDARARWSGQSDPAFQSAQRVYDYYADLVANGPARLEDLQRELHENCP